MNYIIFFEPDSKSAEAIKQKLTDSLIKKGISTKNQISPKIDTGILLVDAMYGPMKIAIEQLIKARKNKFKNVFGFVYNSNAIFDKDLLNLVKEETDYLLKQYGYLNPKFSVFSDRDDIEKFSSFVCEQINNNNQVEVTSPQYICRFCGYTKHDKFQICPSCQKNQKNHFGSIFYFIKNEIFFNS